MAAVLVERPRDLLDIRDRGELTRCPGRVIVASAAAGSDEGGDHEGHDPAHRDASVERLSEALGR
jgi:hypothetical protein